MLGQGAKAPSFTLPTNNGSFNFADYHDKTMVVFFFTRVDTSGCTKEAIAFSALQDEFDAANCVVISISKDTLAKQAKFQAKHGLSCLLGADDKPMSASNSASRWKNQCTATPIWTSNALLSRSISKG